MKRHTIQKIYLDTNVLINYCTGQVKEREALDLKKGRAFPNTDIEDSIHYVLSQKHKCDAIITNNVSDFVYFRDVEVLKPERRLLSLKIR